MGEVISPSDQAFDPEAHLAFGDVRVNDVKDPQFLEVRLKASKIPAACDCLSGKMSSGHYPGLRGAPWLSFRAFLPAL